MKEKMGGKESKGKKKERERKRKRKRKSERGDNGTLLKSKNDPE